MALTSIIGTLIPQNADPIIYQREYGETIFRLFDLLNIFDMYHSLWFQMLMALLTVNIIICSINRLSSSWKIIFAENPKFNPARYQKLAQQEKFNNKSTPDELSMKYKPFLHKYFGNFQMLKTEKDLFLFGEKWRWTRLGVYIVHSSIVFLLIGGIIGSLFGFDGFITIPEGQSIDHVQLRYTNKILPLGFSIRCDDFDISFYLNGMPREYRSSLTILEQGREVLKRNVIVNDPLRYKGINIFQASYGKIQPEPPKKEDSLPPDPEKEISLIFTSNATGMTYRKNTRLGEPLKMPEDTGKIMLVEFTPAALFMGQNIGAAYLGILTPSKGTPARVQLSLGFPNFDKMRKGAMFISIAKKDEKVLPMRRQPAQKYYTGLQITKDPGVWVVYFGFILMIVGCFITFFMSHQSICIKISKGPENSVITVSGIANKNKLGMENKIRRISHKLADLS